MSDHIGAPSRPPSPYTDVERRALVAVATQFFVNGALFASFLPRLPEIRDQVDISVARVGLLLSIAGFAGLVGSAVVGPAIARLGTRTVMITAGTVVSLSLPVVGLAQTQVVLLVGLVGMLTFDVLVDVAMNMQGSWLSARRHTPVMSRLHGLWSLGTVVGGLTSSRLAAAGVSLSVHLSVAGALLLLALVFVGRGLLRTDQPPEPDSTGNNVEAQHSSQPRFVLVLFALAGLFAVAIESTSIDWAAFRFTDDYAATASFAALGYVAVTAGMTIGRFTGDWASQRLGPQRLNGYAITLTGLGLIIATLPSNRQLNLAGYLTAGIGIATMLPTIYDQAAKHPGRPGAGLGALTAGLRTATLTIPLVVGTVAATNLSVGTTIAAITLPAVIGFALVTKPLIRATR